MKTERFGSSEHDLQKAAALLAKGELVAFPTETVYGLGAHALDERAVDKIFQAKGRPSDNPLIIHIGDIRQLAQVAASVPPVAQICIEAFWPGPLTLILPRQAEVPDNVTAGLDTVGVRMPDHPVALDLLRISGLPVAAPSANRSGRPSPTTAGHVLDDLEGRIAAVIDGGTTGVGVESTVLDVTADPPMILRPGGVTKEMLERVIGSVDIDPTLTEQPKVELVPRSPGMKYTHYAPQGEMWIVEGDWDLPTTLESGVQAGKMDKQADKLQGLVDRSRAEGYKTGVLTTDERANRYQADAVLSCGSRRQLESIAAGLYHALREFDRLGIERIYAESFPGDGIGFAIMNRLRKAAGYRVIG